VWTEVAAGVLVVVFGVATALLGNRLRKVKKVVKELAEAMTTTYKAIEDGKLSLNEAKQLIKEWSDVAAELHGGLKKR